MRDNLVTRLGRLFQESSLHRGLTQILRPEVRGKRQEVRASSLKPRAQLLHGERGKKTSRQSRFSPLTFQVVYYTHPQSSVNEKVFLYVDEHTIRLYFEELKTRHRPATLNTKKYALMKIFKAIFAEDHVMKNVLVEKAIEKTFQQIPSYKTDKVVDDVLSEETVKDIIDAAPTQKTKLILRFLFKTGCRVSEMVNIRLSDCESKRKYVRLRIIGKGNKERELYIPKDLFSEIQQEFRGKSYLFESETGRQLHRRNVSKQVRRAGLRAGFNITSHDLRHARATDLLLRKNVSLKAVSRYLGHSTTATTADMYIHDEFSVSEIFSQDSF